MPQISRNDALLRRARATKAYTMLLFDAAGDAILRAHAAQLRAKALLQATQLNRHGMP